VSDLVADNVSNYTDSCLRRAQGNQREADYLMDCGYFEYYYRVVKYNEYVKWHNEQMKK
jgi:hypothetical protein